MTLATRYRIPSDVAVRPLLALLGERFRLVPEATTTRSRRWLDTADWRAWSRGVTVEVDGPEPAR